MSRFNHASWEVYELTLCYYATHCLCLTSKEILQHENAFFLGTSFVEASPVTTAPELLSNNVCLLSVPCKQRDAIEESVSLPRCGRKPPSGQRNGLPGNRCCQPCWCNREWGTRSSLDCRWENCPRELEVPLRQQVRVLYSSFVWFWLFSGIGR